MTPEGENSMEKVQAAQSEASNAHEQGGRLATRLHEEAERTVRELEEVWQDKLRFEKVYPKTRESIQKAIDELERLQKENKMEDGDEARLEQLKGDAIKIDEYSKSLTDESKRMYGRPHVAEKVQTEALQEDVDRNAEVIVKEKYQEADKILAEIPAAHKLYTATAGEEEKSTFEDFLKTQGEQYRALIRTTIEGMEPKLASEDMKPELEKAIEKKLWEYAGDKLYSNWGFQDIFHISVMEILKGKGDKLPK
ncbi:hypothetical protein ACFL0L_04375 [Patescibacteria group bacterium]